MEYNQEDDAQLINRILSGDDYAFNILVHKYQKGIHALVWRKVGDFHYAEEITQDTFLKAYSKLSTLKEPSQFAGWLYVIANRLCINWCQRSKSTMQSLENIHVKDIVHSSYEHYISEQREAKATEHRYDLVKKLLSNLPESERTVITLYYLGEMTTKEISKFLGVSVHTITSRLQRARRRLQDNQELLIQEVLGGIQIPARLSQNIMRQVADIKPIPSPVGKPFLPWVAFGTAVVVTLLLMLGMSNQYLVRFQKPYSFEARSEPTVEIIDAPVTLNIESKPAVRNQAGSAAIPSENRGVGLQTSENILAPNTQQNPFRPSTSQWTQASGPQGSDISEIFVTSQGHLYTATTTGIYNLTADATAWTLINASVPTGNFPMPMAEHNDTLYIVSNHKVFASTDNGETWNTLGSRPKGDAVGLIITDGAYDINSRLGITMYLALENKGVFRSTDAGGQWDPLKDGLIGKRVYAIDAIGSTVFVGTNEGLYRLNSDVWKQLPVDASNAVHALAVMKNNLYVATGPDSFLLRSAKRYERYFTRLVTKDTATPWKSFQSTDLGMSWTEITPKNKPSVGMASHNIKILVAGKTLLALDGIRGFRSNDAGQTWTDLEFNIDSVKQNIFTTIAIDDNIFCIAGGFGVYRTIDGGDSWHPFMEGVIGTKVRSLTTFNNRLYAHTGSDVVQSIDGGESWKSVHLYAKEDLPKSIGREQPRVNFYFHSKLAVADRGLYGIVPDGGKLHIFSLSMDDNTLIPVQGLPAFDGEMLSTRLWTAIAKAERLDIPDNIEGSAKLMKALRSIATFVVAGGFAVNDETFYVEYQRQLFKWKLGDPKWTNTGLIDLGEQPIEDLSQGFRLAASGEIVYVGKRAGQLFQSFDGGNSWRDVTSNLPLRFARFNEIIFVGATVYVATNTGVLASQSGEHWRVLTDGIGTRVVIDRFAVDHTTIYGAGNTGLYRLDARGHWEQISPNVPDKVISLVVNNDRLYIATQHRGMFHISLRKESYNALSQK